MIRTMETPESENKRLLQEIERLRADMNLLADEIARTKRESTTAFIIGDAIADGICVTDGQGVVTSINRGYTEITGIREDEILGRSVDELVREGYFSNAVSMEAIKRKEKVSAMSVIRKNENRVLLVGTPFLDADGEVESVITVMRNLTELIRLREELDTAEKKKEQYKAQIKSLKKEQADRGFIGSSDAILHVKDLIGHVAHSDATVLITGETGSGKEVVAREIYKLSNRKNGPYVKVNCAAIPDGLIESELFGYERGAFTGAGPKEKKGYFEMANGGTILLDEISEMPVALQPKILRVLQEKEITRVGGVHPVSLDIRIIASTNRVLKDMIAAGGFRADLYYRINVFPIHLPPLRERRGDIRALAENFLGRFNALYEKSKNFTDEAMRQLCDHDWPGNVRELENAVERMVIILPGKHITRENVRALIGGDRFEDGESAPPFEAPSAADGIGSLRELVADYEKSLILRAVETYGSSYSAAKALGTSQPTIVRKAHAFGIPLTGKE
ncbi:MAG: sigma 54-interacting transcriptional regulator [Clostridiales Family XIII bacterium]|jgi:PAS domain S-box-containing protein|nr:sigma 54-interacting transcriptional regulator [Clostridiales Family XIII bacterium]